jgi:Flp pilus assembly protein TadG
VLRCLSEGAALGKSLRHLGHWLRRFLPGCAGTAQNTSELHQLLHVSAPVPAQLLSIPTPCRAEGAASNARKTGMGHLVKQRCAFWADEDGNITIFSLFMVMLILAITGAAVDIMRFEATRAKMQSTMDRAVLAAADLDQEQDPTAVVQDYMLKAGLDEVLAEVNVEQGLNHRTVAANGSADLETIFLKMSGLDSLTAPAASTAEEKISNVEISLVLDVSGSMNGSRITNMRAAAAEFVDTVIQPTGEGSGLTTVSVVPYNATVNLGTTVAGYWTLDNLHNYSNCVIFDNDEFDTVAISPSTELTRLAHFDLYSTSQTTTSLPNPWCKTGDTSAVMVHSSDKTALGNHIAGLTAGGNTAIDLGVKWGVALLDPAARPAVSAMAGDGLVVADAAARPAEYDDPEAIKFVVVMTDGANTTEYDLKYHHKYGMSDIWVDDRGTSSLSDDRYSLLVDDNYGTNNDVYFWERYENYSASYRYDNFPDGGNNARRMSNAEIFARFGTKGLAKKMYVKPYYDGYVSYNTYRDVYYGYTSIVNGSAADARLSDICDAAKDTGIVIFSIAFEAPSGGQIALADCASSPSHYFDVEGVEITDTFHAIARQINSLRLIQ